MMLKRILYPVLFTIVFFCCFIGGLKAQDIQVLSRLDKNSILIGDQTVLRVIVHQPAKEHVDGPKFTDTISSKIQIVGAPKLDTIIENNDKNQITVRQNIVITAFDAGSYTIPPFNVSTKGGVLKTNEQSLKVETVKVDTTKAIYDIKDPMAVNYNWLDWLRDNWPWVVIVLLVIAIVTGVIWYLRTRPKVEKVVEEVKPVMPIHAIALNKLNELRNRKLWQNGQVKEYYIELSDVLREYIEKRYDVKTHEKTTEEIFLGLKHKEITGENRHKLSQVLLLSDLVKFAKENPPPAENDLSMDNAVSFVMQTQQIITIGGTDEPA